MEKRRSQWCNRTAVWVCGRSGHGPDHTRVTHDPACPLCRTAKHEMELASLIFSMGYQSSAGNLVTWLGFRIRTTAHSYVLVTGNYSCDSGTSVSPFEPLRRHSRVRSTHTSHREPPETPYRNIASVIANRA